MIFRVVITTVKDISFEEIKKDFPLYPEEIEKLEKIKPGDKFSITIRGDKEGKFITFEKLIERGSN